jgi:hypothetical protein
MVMLVEQILKSGQYPLQGDSNMLKKGSIVLSIWCVINFMLAFIILCYVIVLKNDSPILQVASFSEAEIASLSDKTIAALNCFTILYNSCSLVIFRFLIYWAWPLAGERCSERFIPGGHWPVGLFTIQVQAAGCMIKQSGKRLL